MTARVFHSVDDARGQFGPCALAIGNFDGVHVGHRALIQATRREAGEHALFPSVLTFHPHPTAVVAPERTPQMICPLEERLELLSALGIERILVLPFTPSVAKMSPRQFVEEILAGALQAKAIVVGENFLFGHKQAGNAASLRQLGTEFGFAPQLLKPVVVRGEVVSSSAIRKYVAAGNVSRAGRLLGRCFALKGPVIKGHGVGSRQTVPTLNIRPVAGQVLPRGVYITETRDPDSGRRWPSITNSGTRPTFNGSELTVETFLLSPLESDAPHRIQLEFRRFVRPERQFPSPEALKQQILADVSHAQTYWRRISNLRQTPASI